MKMRRKKMKEDGSDDDDSDDEDAFLAGALKSGKATVEGGGECNH